MPNLISQSIGRYLILEQLGEGGMATVYKAYDTRLERDVAFKVLRTDQFIPAQLQMVLQRFEREAKSLAKLSHPNIINILDYGEHEGMPYLVMEYLPGGTLKQKLGRALPWREALRLLIPVAQGLAYAHGRGIIHRDVKPANILLKESGMPVLTDFGIAKLLEAGDGHTLTGSGVGIGTPEYMAPEQGIGAKVVDARADIYSLGIVLYEMVTGRKPYVADTPMAVVIKQINDPLPRPTDFASDLPIDVEYLLLKALAKQPDDRYADMNAMLAVMEGLLKEVPTVPAPPPEKKAPGHAKISLKVIPAVMGVLIIGVIAIIALLPLIRQVPAAPAAIETPEAAVTSTAAAIVPTSTFTFAPPTTTPEPSLTPTSAFTSTPTPFPTEITDEKGVSMRLVPAGEFTMGIDTGFADAKPAHKIILEAYYIDKFEVTNAAYEACVKAQVCEPPKNIGLDFVSKFWLEMYYIAPATPRWRGNYTYTNIHEYYYGNPIYANYPVVFVNWSMARTYCETWRSARLPTEAEWEKAARGSSGNQYPWGNQFDCHNGNFGDAFLIKRAERGEDYTVTLQEPTCDGYTGTFPVGTLPGSASAYGVFDLAGNVAEWTNSVFMPYPYSATDGRESATGTGNRRVYRGGSFLDIGDQLLSYYRPTTVTSNTTVSVIGFRCASSVDVSGVP